MFQRTNPAFSHKAILMLFFLGSEHSRSVCHKGDSLSPGGPRQYPRSLVALALHLPVPTFLNHGGGGVGGLLTGVAGGGDAGVTVGPWQQQRGRGSRMRRPVPRWGEGT